MTGNVLARRNVSEWLYVWLLVISKLDVLLCCFAAYLCLLEDMEEDRKTEQSVPFLYPFFILPWNLETSRR